VFAQSKDQVVQSTVDDILQLDGQAEVFNRDIQILNLTMAPIDGGNNLLESTDLRLSFGHRYGLVGRNGSGKTTLLRHLVSGLPEIPKYLRIHTVCQEMEGGTLTVKETVMAADKERTALKSELYRINKVLSKTEKDEDKVGIKEDEEENAVILERYNAILSRLEFIGSTNAEARAVRVLNGLQFTARMQNLPTEDLSGG